MSLEVSGVVQGISRAAELGPMLKQPASEKGAGRFVQPLIHECSDFFAQVGGVGQTGELVAFKGVD